MCAGFVLLTALAAGCDETGVAPDTSADTSPDTTVATSDAATETTTPADSTPADSTPADSTPADTNDVGAPPTELAPVLASETGRLTTLVPGDVTWVARLDEGRVGLVREGRVELLTGAGPVDLGAAPDGDVRAAAWLPSGRVLLAAGDDLLVEDDAALVPSPLADALADPVLALARVGDDLWLATATELARLRGAELRIVSAPDVDLTSRLLVPGPSPIAGAAAALWLATDDGVVALVADGPRLEAWTLARDLVATSLALDARGRAWAVVDGRAFRRAPAASGVNAWLPIVLPSAVLDVLALPSTPHVWIVTADGLVHEVDDTWAAVTATLPAARAHALDETGTLMRATAEGLIAVSPGRLLSLSGLAPGALLERATPIEVRVSDPDHAVVVAKIDGEPVAATLVGEGAARVFRVTLSPDPLDRGPHLLTVDVTYDDDATHLATSLPFEVMHVTWADEVKPLYEKRCATCHNAVAGASTAVLATPDAWVERYDCILCRVTQPLDPASPACQACEDFASPMPPFGKLTPTDLDHLHRWRASGFREE
ncbi:MAG: hypothetical protein IT385_27365 [Deltaproteobacteria bacterium]|nr:hypothetical protein [Deltaproteobacteria bacterium]